jgi:hypothetical protein
MLDRTILVGGLLESQGRSPFQLIRIANQADFQLAYLVLTTDQDMGRYRIVLSAHCHGPKQQ